MYQALLIKPKQSECKLERYKKQIVIRRNEKKNGLFYINALEYKKAYQNANYKTWQYYGFTNGLKQVKTLDRAIEVGFNYIRHYKWRNSFYNYLCFDF